MSLRISMLLWFGLALIVSAQEKIPVLKVGNDVYQNVTVNSVTATDVYFTHSKGMANVKLKNLDADWQKHFHYDAANARKTEEKQAQAAAEFHKQILAQHAPRPTALKKEDLPEAAQQTAELSWSTDVPAAISRAGADGKMVLLDFTGSDWCGWCMKFDREVFSTSQFADYARNKLILVKLDFPHHITQEESLQQANAELARKYHVDGFPTFVILNSSGTEIGRQDGYAAGGPAAFIAMLERLNK